MTQAKNERKWKFIPTVISVWKESSGHGAIIFDVISLCGDLRCAIIHLSTHTYHKPNLIFVTEEQSKMDIAETLSDSCHGGSRMWLWEGVVPGSLKVLVISLSSCSAPGILQFTMCPLNILSVVCFYLLKFLSRNPSRQRLTMALLYVGFLSSSSLVPPYLVNSLKRREV